MICMCDTCQGYRWQILSIIENGMLSIIKHENELHYLINQIIERKDLNVCATEIGAKESVERFKTMQAMEREFREDGQDFILERQQEKETSQTTSNPNG